MRSGLQNLHVHGTGRIFIDLNMRLVLLLTFVLDMSVVAFVDSHNVVMFIITVDDFFLLNVDLVMCVVALRDDVDIAVEVSPDRFAVDFDDPAFFFAAYYNFVPIIREKLLGLSLVKRAHLVSFGRRVHRAGQYNHPSES